MGREKHDFDRYEYEVTEGQRKCWDGEPDLSEEGWEEWRDWERFDFTEVRYWRRPLTGKALARAKQYKQIGKRLEATKKAERKVIEAAKALLKVSSRQNAPYLGVGYTGALEAFYDAVEALQALEKGEG